MTREDALQRLVDVEPGDRERWKPIKRYADLLAKLARCGATERWRC